VNLRLVVPYDVDQPTGGNVYDLALADALRQDGDEVDIVPCRPVDLATVLARPTDGVTVVDGLLACRQPDAVETARVAVLVHMPLALEDGPPERVAEAALGERRALRAATTVIATSNWSAQYLVQRHQVADVVVATPGVEPAPIVTGSQPPLLVQLAALLPHKDQLGVVAALSRVRDLPWNARLAGPLDRDVGYSAAVRDAIAAADLARRIELPGVMDRDAAWAGADLALLPSTAETFGMVVTEALARGIPVIVGEGGSAEALGRTAAGERPGVVIPSAEPERFASELRRWLSEPDYRQELRARALARRDTLEGWETTAGTVRGALLGT
jgi:glycosyltransferase involved in cell wall biosynthesis